VLVHIPLTYIWKDYHSSCQLFEGCCPDITKKWVEGKTHFQSFFIVHVHIRNMNRIELMLYNTHTESFQRVYWVREKKIISYLWKLKKAKFIVKYLWYKTFWLRTTNYFYLLLSFCLLKQNVLQIPELPPFICFWNYWCVHVDK